MTAIYKRELKSYFTGISGYIFIAFLLLMVGIYAAVINFHYTQPNFESVLGSVGLVFLLIVPILTMRTFAEERRQKTDQLLYALPLSMAEIVFGKYLAMLTVLLIPTAVICVYPVVLSFYGSIDLLTCYSTLFAFFLMGSALLAVGMFISSTTDNQIVAAVVSFAALLLLYLMTQLASFLPVSAAGSLMAFAVVILLAGLILYLMTRHALLASAVIILLMAALYSVYLLEPTLLEGAFQTAALQLSVFDRLYTFIDGIFDLSGVVYYLSFAGVFVFFTIQSLEKRRWS